MFTEIEKPDSELTLAQRLVRKVLTETGNKLKAIDDNRALIIDCDILSALIKDAGGFMYTGNPVVTVFDGGVLANVNISYQPLSAVRSAIRQAGLHIYAEERMYDADRMRDELRIELVGHDCGIRVFEIAEEISEAA